MLRLAAHKLGMVLKFKGTEEFKKKTVMAALKIGLQVTFDDPRMSALLESHYGRMGERAYRATGARIRE